MIEQDKILEKIGDVIKENFPFYASYKTNLKNEYYYEISVTYYYMGEQVTLNQFIPRYGLEETEKSLDRFKDLLVEIKKDLISYPNNKTQQEFLRKER